MEKSGLLRVNLKIEVRDRRGRLLDVREKRSDLILDNFKDILSAMLYPRETLLADTARYAALVDLGGTAFDVAILSTLAAASGQGLNFVGVINVDFLLGVTILIGTSTVAPTRGDYDLGARLAEGTPTQTVGADYISWAVSIVLEAAADIAEAGLLFTCVGTGFKAPPAYKGFLMFRDTFTPVSVPAGGTISITYTLTL